VYELTSYDLAQIPAWEFAQDEETVAGQDEATVRPYFRHPVDPSDGLLVVRARFTLVDGTRLLGFVSPAPPTMVWDISNQQPSIVSDKGQIPLYFGIFPPGADRLKEFFELLGKLPDEVFPLNYKTDVEIIGGPVVDTIMGFAFLDRDSQAVQFIGKI
jgi:hypothetical protein